MADQNLNAQQDAVASRLGAAWAADLIDEAEFERRVTAVYAARESAALELLVHDLPTPAAPALVADTRPGSNAVLRPLRRIVLGSIQERVRGVVPPRVEFGVRLGALELDLTQATFLGQHTEIVLDVVLGNVELCLPHDMIVESQVDGMLSSVEYHDGPHVVSDAARTVRITGRCVLGSVEIRSAR